MPELIGYGENSFTFLFFKALTDFCQRNGDTPLATFLSSLRPLVQGNGELVVKDLDRWRLWLFPNFGKRHGFGEPDAVLLAGRDSFWFEVETDVSLTLRRFAFEHALLQLARFRAFAVVLGQSRSLPRSFEGVTITDSGRCRTARVNRKKHPVLRDEDFVARVRASVCTERDHYVLFSLKEPTGVTKADSRELVVDRLRRHSIDLAAFHAEHTTAPARGKPLEMPVDRFWRVSWRGNLERKLDNVLGHPLASLRTRN
jgi:hypothetical protein